MVDDVGRPQQSGVSHLGLSVTDLDRSISFYCDVLGALLVRPAFNGDRPPFSGRTAILMLGLTVLDLYEHAGNGGERFEPARTGLDHLAFVAESYEEVDAWARWLDIQIEFCFIDQQRLRQYSSAASALDSSEAS